MVRPRRNIPERQNKPDRRFTDKIYDAFKKLFIQRNPHKFSQVVLTKQDWLKDQAQKIVYEDISDEFHASLKLKKFYSKFDSADIQRALCNFAWRMKDVPRLAMLVSYLLFLKIPEGEQVFFKVCSLTHAQLKILNNNPQMLQNPARLEIALGLSAEQMTIFDEEIILSYPPEGDA